MATIYNPNEENDKPGQTGQAGSSISSGGRASSQGKPTSSGRFTNIQNYLRANQQSNLGQNLQNKLEQRGEKAQQGIQQSQQQFQQQANQAFTPFQGAQQFTQQAIQNAAQTAQDPNAFQRFQTIAAGQYAGPKELQNFGSLQANVQNIKSLGNLSNTESGRFALLKNLVGGQGYSRGQQTLDQLILQGRQPNLQALQRTGNVAQGQLTQAQTAAMQQGKQFTEQAKQAGEEALSGVGSAVQGLQTDLEQRVAAEKAAQQQLFGNIQAQLGGKIVGEQEIDQDVLNRLTGGLGLEAGQSLYNVNPLDYVQKGYDPTTQTVATPEQYAFYKGLEKLRGGNEYLLTDPSKAGEFARQGPLVFDKNRFQETLSQGQKIFEADPQRGHYLYDVNATKNELNKTQAESADRYNQAKQLYNELQQIGPVTSQLTPEQLATRNAKEQELMNLANQGIWDFFAPQTGYQQLLQSWEGVNAPTSEYALDPNQTTEQNRARLMADMDRRIAENLAYKQKQFNEAQSRLRGRETELGAFQKLKGRLGA